MNEFITTLIVAAATCAVTILTTELVKGIINKVKQKNSEVQNQAGKCETRFQSMQRTNEKFDEKLDTIMECLDELKKNGPEEYQVLKKGVQAILRRDMLTEYKEAKKKRYSTLEEKENFNNMYNAYHNLGENGVMDKVHEEYLEMPSDKPHTRNTSHK